MNKSTVVKVQNITKIYKLYEKPFDRVKESLNPLKKKYHKEFHALDNVSFELKRGEALGVIGRNGNGKSTLLKIIARVLTPTKGHSNVKGKISAILELTSSLKPELTGLENIDLNLKISGFKENELKEKIIEIEEFAEIGEFINQPVKTYSSGMKSRLGFGIATSSEPDILILDEVLAVGDFNFQQKCLAKINSMRENISMIFVSHSMNSVRLFCDSVLVLEKGKKTFYGKADDGIKYYLEQEEKKKLELKKKEKNQDIKPFYGDLFHNEEKISDVKFTWLDNNENEISSANLNEKISLKISFDLFYTPNDLVIGIPFWTENGDFITGVSTEMTQYSIDIKGGKCEVVCQFSNIFNPGKYISIISINDGAENLVRTLNNTFESKNTTTRYFGFVTVNHKWLPQAAKNKNIRISDILFKINSLDKSGFMYEGKSSYEELNTKLYTEIQKKFNPQNIFDIGANYGFTGIVFAKVFQQAKITLVEASSNLSQYIESNLSHNITNNYEIHNAICAEISNEQREFSLNPSGSQDNRVVAVNDNWSKEVVPTISLDKLFEVNPSNFYFIKIDTQGYEENVFNGGQAYLTKNCNWIIKTEFAPHWLESQGSNPKEFLQKLISHYNVVESPSRCRFKGDSLNDIFKQTIRNEEVEQFIEYITAHNKNGRGWCDLYIYPKGLHI